MTSVLKFFLTLIAASACAQTLVNGRPSVVLDGGTAQVVIDLGGGSITEFQFNDQRLNPLTWNSGEESSAAHAMGHFLCLDRWGAPSEAESKNGMPFHGEAAQVQWKVLRQPAPAAGAILAEMSATLPMAGLAVSRQVRLTEKLPLLAVSESVTNTNKLGRVYNMVQHPSIAPPFLDETTVVDANARRGFMQSSPLPNPEEPAVYWPQALKDGQPVNLRRLAGDDEPNVVSFTIDEEFGWTTASNAAKGLLIGYIWKTSDYPWLDVWRYAQKGRAAARGMEFGTTGLHQPEAILVSKGKIFGRLIYAYIDAGQTVTRSYAAFLFRIPADYHGVDRIAYESGRLILHERGAGPERDLVMPVGDLFPPSSR